MKHTTETQIKYWQSRLAHAIEDKETAERKLGELGVAPAAMEPEVVPEDDGWHSGDEPPYEQDLVQVKLNNGLILNGWHDLNQWNVYYPSCVDLFDGDPLRPGDTVQSWKEID